MKNNNHNGNDFDLALEVGELKGLVNGINDRLDKVNGHIDDIIGKVNKHDTSLAKIAWLGSLVGTVVATLITVGLNWLIRGL